MTNSDSFQNIFPIVLENMSREVGELIGEALELDRLNISQGILQEIFSPPGKESVLITFQAKEGDFEPAYLLADLDLAIDLGARLVLLPEDEIDAIKNRKKLEGEVEDAFSEVANIIAGVVTRACRQFFVKKLHFVRGDLEVFSPGSQAFPFSNGMHAVISGSFKSERIKPGDVHLIFPHALLEEKNPEKVPEEKKIEVFLLESLSYLKDELDSLLGASVEFVEPQAKLRHKKDLITKTKGKQVLTRIEVSGDRAGEGYILLPLKDAIFLGGTLVMMPPESITQSIKQGRFEGEVADAFGEILNILAGCHSNRFKENYPLKLALKRGAVELLVPSQVDLSSNDPFASESFYLLSAKIRMEKRVIGPMEICFPLEILGLTPDGVSFANVEKGLEEPEKSESLNGFECQKNDIGSVSLIVYLIGQDQTQLAMLSESMGKEDVELMMLSPDSDLKRYLCDDNLCCVILFVNKTNDMGFAQTIKVRAALKDGCPLIVAGPDWTQTKVLKALKYGATDILTTPAETESIRKKYQKHLLGHQEQANEYNSDAEG